MAKFKVGDTVRVIGSCGSCNRTCYFMGLVAKINKVEFNFYNIIGTPTNREYANTYTNCSGFTDNTLELVAPKEKIIRVYPIVKFLNSLKREGE